MVWPAPRNWARTKAGTADKGNLLRVDHCQGKIYRLRKSSQILRHICTNNLVTTCPKQPWPHLLLGSYGPQKMPQLPGSPPKKSLLSLAKYFLLLMLSLLIFMKALSLHGNMNWKTTHHHSDPRWKCVCKKSSVWSRIAPLFAFVIILNAPSTLLCNISLGS